MSSFQERYHRYDTIWQDCYLGYFLADLETLHPGLVAVVDFFASNGEFALYLASPQPEWLVITETSLSQVESEEAIRELEESITQAIRYGSHERLPDGEARLIASDFLAVFEAPIVFSNRGRQVTGSYPYSREAFICCIDRGRFGFFLSVENE